MAVKRVDMDKQEALVGCLYERSTVANRLKADRRAVAGSGGALHVAFLFET